jgi:hypothetical protein
MQEVSSSSQELSGDAQYAFGFLYECRDLLTCIATHMHKSDNNPPPPPLAPLPPPLPPPPNNCGSGSGSNSGDSTTIN